MSQEKAQLIAPIGIVTFAGINATGIITGIGFSGNVGVAKSVVNGTSITAGVITATSFAGNLTGNILRLADSAPDINVGVSTATSFVGNLTGSVTDLTSAPAITVGMVTATTLEGPVTGNITGNVSGLAQGGLGVGYNGGWPGAGTSQINAGVVTATTFYGDGSTLDGISSGPVSQQSIGITSATTSIDLSNGNIINANQSADTTVSFASTANGNVYFIRIKDATNTSRAITWPGTIQWDGGTTPSLNNLGVQGPDPQIFLLTTRDMGVTWYGKEIFNIDVAIQLWTWGDGTTGRTSHNDRTQRSSPTQVPGSYEKIFPTSAGNSKYFLFSKNSGDLWGAGESYEGGLGTGDKAYYSSPVQIGTDTTWSSVVGGENATIATKTNGSLWMWGNNSYGELGENSRTQRSSPIQIGTAVDWSTNISTGQGAAFAIKTNGTLWAWGNGSQYGTLGLNAQENRSSPTQVGSDNSWSSFSTVGGDSGNIGALKTDGTFWVWGRQYGGTLGLNEGTADNNNSRSSPTQLGGESTWASVSNGPGGMLATKTNGTLWAWGYNSFGQLGKNDLIDRSSPVQIGTQTTWSQVSQRVRFGHSSIAMKTDGTMWVWGYNQSTGTVLGLNDTVNRSSPTQLTGTWNSFDLSTYNGSVAALRSS